MRRSWVALLLLPACTGAVRSFDVYESKAGETAKVAVSAVQTARLAVDAARGDKAYGSIRTLPGPGAPRRDGPPRGRFTCGHARDRRGFAWDRGRTRSGW
jgi:hypothetical protein